MPNAENADTSSGRGALRAERERLDAALAKLEATVAERLAEERAAAESRARIEALEAERDQLTEALEREHSEHLRLQDKYDSQKAELEDFRAAQDDDEEDLRGAYEALRQQHDKALNELDEIRRDREERDAEEGTRLVRELAAARSAHKDLERAYESLKSEIVALKNSAGPTGAADLELLKAETARVDEALVAKRAELDRLSSIRDEIAERLGRVIDQLETLTENEA